MAFVPTSPTDGIDMLASFPPTAAHYSGHAAVPRPVLPAAAASVQARPTAARKRALAPIADRRGQHEHEMMMRTAQQIAVLLQANLLPGQAGALQELFQQCLLCLHAGATAPPPPAPPQPPSQPPSSWPARCRTDQPSFRRRTRASPGWQDSRSTTAPRTFAQVAQRAVGKLQTSAKSLRRQVLLRQLIHGARAAEIPCVIPS